MFEAIRELWEEVNESWEYDVSDEIVQMGKFLGQKGYSLRLANTTKAYSIGGTIWFEVLLRIREYQLYCNIIENLDTCFRKQLHIHLISRHRDTSMLGNVTEEIQYPKRMTFVRIPAVVWLQRLDFIPRILGEAFCNQIEMFLSFAVPIFADGEFGALVRKPIGGVEQGKFPCQIVQRSSKCLEYVGSKDAESRRRRSEIHPSQVCSFLRLFCFDGWGIGLYESTDFLIQDGQVFHRPRELQPWTIHAHFKELYHNRKYYNDFRR
jgi:hypothetical protein